MEMVKLTMKVSGGCTWKFEADQIYCKKWPQFVFQKFWHKEIVVLFAGVTFSFARYSTTPHVQTFTPIQYTSWVVQCILNNVLHNPGALPVCVRPFYVLRKDGVLNRYTVTTFNISLNQLPSVLYKNLVNWWSLNFLTEFAEFSDKNICH